MLISVNLRKMALRGKPHWIIMILIPLWVWFSQVDDDDRDFRRSRRHDPEASGGGVGGTIRKITAPISGGGAGRIALGKKRGLNSLADTGGVTSSRYVRPPCKNVGP